MEKVDEVVPMQRCEGEIGEVLYESSPDCIKVLSLNGTIKRLNLGGQIALELDLPNQLDGAYWPSLWPGSEQARVELALAEARKGRRSQFLASCPTLKGSTRWWDVVVGPLSSHEGGVLAVSRDVTDLVSAREALALANERKNQFMAVLSHELRNPLSTLSMAATILEASAIERGQVQQVVDTMKRQIGYMSRLAEDLLDISRITRGEVSLRMADFDLREAVQESVEQLAAVASRKGQPILACLPDAPAKVRGDRMRLIQVFGNLIANASRYSPANVPIRLTLSSGNRWVSVAIADEGIGISDELRPRLFDFYTQGHVPNDSRSSGVGLGLAIVKGLVDLHGGAIEVHSAGFGMGSTFTVSLPESDNC